MYHNLIFLNLDVVSKPMLIRLYQFFLIIEYETEHRETVNLELKPLKLLLKSRLCGQRARQ